MPSPPLPSTLSRAPASHPLRHRHVNVNQKRYAVASALAATAVPALVMARGHRVEEVPELPLVVDTSLESCSKTAAALATLTALGAAAEVEKVRRDVAVVWLINFFSKVSCRGGKVKGGWPATGGGRGSGSWGSVLEGILVEPFDFFCVAHMAPMAHLRVREEVRLAIAIFLGGMPHSMPPCCRTWYPSLTLFGTHEKLSP